MIEGMEQDIKKGIIDLQREKLEQLKAAVRKVRVDEIVEHMKGITEDLLRSYKSESEGMYKLKMLEAIRKNFEFMVKVADVPFQLGAMEDSKETNVGVEAISWEEPEDVIDVN